MIWDRQLLLWLNQECASPFLDGLAISSSAAYIPLTGLLAIFLEELLQSCSAWRSFDPLDLEASIAGAALFGWLGELARQRPLLRSPPDL